MKLTLKELRSIVAERFADAKSGDVNLWSHEFYYDPQVHTVEALVKAALQYFHQDKSFMKVASPADKRFLDKLITRLQFLHVPHKQIREIVFRLRLAGATNKA